MAAVGLVPPEGTHGGYVNSAGPASRTLRGTNDVWQDMAAVIVKNPPPGDASPRSMLLYRASQTFLARTPPPSVMWLRIFTIAGILLLFFVIIPVFTAANIIPDYKLNFLGKYLCFAIVALGIDLVWGYTGLLSLCQALFFGIGGYIMAMHLSLKEGGGDVRPEYNNIPQFMFFNNVHELPTFWKPFASLPQAIILGILLSGMVAGLFGFFILRSRVRGVYFSIITQAVAWGSWLLISRNEMLLGGTNGLTNFYKPMSQARSWIIGLYLLTLTTVVLAYLLCRAITRSRLGRVLVAVRDKETRLYFAGYKPYAFKVFAYAVGAALAGIGGMLYSPQVGIITPQNLNVETSILMVIWVAVGGRGRLWGAIFGALAVNVTLGAISSDLPSFWLYVQGGMFVLVVLLFPDGFVGFWDDVEKELIRGNGWMRAFVMSLPLLLAGIFILAEGLGLTPAVLRTPLYQTASRDQLQLKYVLLICSLAGAGMWRMHLKRKQPARGFPMPSAKVAQVEG